MSKTKIVLASILKPVDDTRMYEKIGYSLSQTKKYEVNIIGFASKKITQEIPGVTLHPIFSFTRLSYQRFIAPFQCLKKIIELKPKLVIVNTHELLIVSCIYKILFGGKVCYDVLENHYRNILYGQGFPRPIRLLIATYVRTKEYMTLPLVDHFFLAEKAYQHELKFIRKRSTILENKYSDLKGQKRPRSNSIHSLIFTGTLAETTGIFRALELTKKLHQIERKISLKIIGFCAQKKELEKLQKEVNKYDFVTLIGGEKLVSHSEIIEAILNADVGLICYPENPSTDGSIPTKLYEYLALQLPILLHKHKTREELCSPYNACLAIDFNNFEPAELWRNIQQHTFYTSTPKEEVNWSSEVKKLIQSMDILKA